MLQEISVFLQLVESKSFTKTSQLLKLSPATVTRRILSLEKQLGVKLVRRNTRTLYLTQEGWYCYERWKNIPYIITEVEEDVRGSKALLQGEINISVSVYSAFVELMPIIASFLLEHPKIKINFVKSNIYPDLLDDSFDIFFRYKETNTRVFKSEPLSSSQLLIAATPHYFKKYDVPTHPNQLQDHNCIIHRVNAHEGEIWYFRENDKDIQIRINGNLTLNNTALVLEAVLNGVGIARLPHFLIKPYLESGQLVSILQNYIPPPLINYLIFPRPDFISGKTQLFVDFILERYRNIQA